MKQIFSPEYRQFRCIAGACPDSCCTDWEIVLDEDAESYYHTVSGELGERLRNAMTTDADGDTIFQEKDHRCPFWNEAHLCDIQGALGETALCETCRQFPRLSQDYGDFIEYDLSIACPEAARMILTKQPEELTLQAESHPELTGDIPEYEPKRMAQLQRLREEMFTALRDTKKPALEQIMHCLDLARKADGNPPTKPVNFTPEECFKALLSCNILTKEWSDILHEAASTPPVPFCITPEWDNEIRAYAFDFLYRHLLCTAFSDSTTECMQYLAFSIYAICLIIAQQKRTTQAERLRIWQLYVKEIEYDTDNEALLRRVAADMAPQFHM